MITRGIIEEVKNKYLIKIRIPILNRTNLSNVRTPTDNLNEGVICTMPNFDPNVKVGDVVIVGFEDNDLGKPIVLGYLYRKNMGETLADLTIGNFEVKGSTKLGENASIGNVTAQEIKYLSGAKGNIQKQINLIKDEIAKIGVTPIPAGASSIWGGMGDMSTADKRLCAGTFADTNATLYTTPATPGAITIVKAITLCNKSSLTSTVTIKLNGVEIISGFILTAFDTITIPYIDQILEASELIEGFAGAGDSITYYISGTEVSP